MGNSTKQQHKSEYSKQLASVKEAFFSKVEAYLKIKITESEYMRLAQTNDEEDSQDNIALFG